MSILNLDSISKSQLLNVNNVLTKYSTNIITFKEGLFKLNGIGINVDKYDNLKTIVNKINFKCRSIGISAKLVESSDKYRIILSTTSSKLVISDHNKVLAGLYNSRLIGIKDSHLIQITRTNNPNNQKNVEVIYQTIKQVSFQNFEKLRESVKFILSLNLNNVNDSFERDIELTVDEDSSVIDNEVSIINNRSTLQSAMLSFNNNSLTRSQVPVLSDDTSINLNIQTLQQTLDYTCMIEEKRAALKIFEKKLNSFEKDYKMKLSKIENMISILNIEDTEYLKNLRKSLEQKELDYEITSLREKIDSIEKKIAQIAELKTLKIEQYQKLSAEIGELLSNNEIIINLSKLNNVLNITKSIKHNLNDLSKIDVKTQNDLNIIERITTELSSPDVTPKHFLDNLILIGEENIDDNLNLMGDCKEIIKDLITRSSKHNILLEDYVRIMLAANQEIITKITDELHILESQEIERKEQLNLLTNLLKNPHPLGLSYDPHTKFRREISKIKKLEFEMLEKQEKIFRKQEKLALIKQAIKDIQQNIVNCKLSIKSLRILVE